MWGRTGRRAEARRAVGQGGKREGRSVNNAHLAVVLQGTGVDLQVDVGSVVQVDLGGHRVGGGDHVQIFIDALHELIGGLVAEAAVTGQQSGHGQGGGVLAGAGVQVSGQGSGAEVAVLLDRGLLMLLVDAQQLEVLGHGQQRCPE